MLRKLDTYIMKHLVFLLFLFTASLGFTQETECQIAFVSEHFVHNYTADTLYFIQDHKDKKKFGKQGSSMYSLPPYSITQVSSLEWAGEFRDPTAWYIMRFSDAEGLLDPNSSANWKFEKKDEAHGTYNLTLN